MRTARTGRRLTAITSAALVALALTACGPEEGEDAPGDNGEEGAEENGSAGDLDIDAYQSIVEGGIVADDDVVEANEWASSIREAGVLHVGGTETSELFSQLNTSDDTLRGFDAGLSQLLSLYILGEVSSELSQITVDTREEVLINNTVDIVFATYSITPERAERVNFAGPYYSSQSGILVHNDTTDIAGVDDLAGRTVATQAASTGVTVLEDEAPEADILELPDHAQALEAVQQGRADAYVIDQSLLLNAVATNDDVQIVGEPFGPGDFYGIGLNPDNDAVDFVNEWLQQIYDDGTWAELWEVAIGDRTGLDETPEPPAIGSGLD